MTWVSDPQQENVHGRRYKIDDILLVPAADVGMPNPIQPVEEVERNAVAVEVVVARAAAVSLERTLTLRLRRPRLHPMSAVIRALKENSLNEFNFRD